MRGKLTAGPGAMVAACLLLSACSPAPHAPAPSAPEPAVSVEVNQSRDQYGKQAIQLQLTNTTKEPLHVAGIRLSSPLFEDSIQWAAASGDLELPPGQPKSLPAPLPAARCDTSSASTPTATVTFTGNTTPGAEKPADETVDATDPFGVLTRNAGELCLATDAAAVAGFALDPSLEVAADGATAVVRLLIKPTDDGGSARSLTVESIDGTTLLAEATTHPWPRNLEVKQGQAPLGVPLGIRPARCDPHAVAEDKVGTLIPLHIKVGDHQGLLKIAASTELRSSIYDFVTAACAQG